MQNVLLSLLSLLLPSWKLNRRKSKQWGRKLVASWVPIVQQVRDISEAKAWLNIINMIQAYLVQFFYHQL